MKKKHANRKEKQGSAHPRYGAGHSDASGFFHFLFRFFFCKETETEADKEKRSNNRPTPAHTPLHTLNARSSTLISALGCMAGTRRPLCRRAGAARYKRYATFNVPILRYIKVAELHSNRLPVCDRHRDVVRSSRGHALEQCADFVDSAQPPPQTLPTHLALRQSPHIRSPHHAGRHLICVPPRCASGLPTPL